MSVNVFGSSGGSKSSSDVNNKYVDQKFVTLSTNLATKVDKSGDIISGNLNMNKNRILNVGNPQEATDAVNKEYTANFLQLTDTGNLHLSNRKIIGLDQSYPLSDLSQATSWFQVMNFVLDTLNEFATKRYLESKIREVTIPNNKQVKNNVGFIPDLFGNKEKGFIVTPNTHSQNNSPRAPFTYGGNSWSADGINAWLQIKLPFKVPIWKFTIAGKASEAKWYDWVFEGSNDTEEWNILKSVKGEYLDSTMKSYILSKPSDSFLYYRFFGVSYQGTNPGLSHLQIYTVDEIY